MDERPDQGGSTNRGIIGGCTRKDAGRDNRTWFADRQGVKRANPIPILLVAVVAFLCANFAVRWAVHLGHFNNTMEAASPDAAR